MEQQKRYMDNRENKEETPNKSFIKKYWGFFLAGGIGLTYFIGKNYGDQISDYMSNLFCRTLQEGSAKTEFHQQGVRLVNDMNLGTNNSSETFRQITVPMYTRRLPAGHKISDEKKRLAEELGYILEKSQTLVTSYEYKKRLVEQMANKQ